MTNLIKNFVGTSSSSCKSNIDEQLKNLQENIQKYENELSISMENWERYIKIGKCQNKISKNYIKYEIENSKKIIE